METSESAKEPNPLAERWSTGLGITRDIATHGGLLTLIWALTALRVQTNGWQGWESGLAVAASLIQFLLWLLMALAGVIARWGFVHALQLLAQTVVFVIVCVLLPSAVASMLLFFQLFAGQSRFEAAGLMGLTLAVLGFCVLAWTLVYRMAQELTSDARPIFVQPQRLAVSVLLIGGATSSNPDIVILWVLPGILAIAVLRAAVLDWLHGAELAACTLPLSPREKMALIKRFGRGTLRRLPPHEELDTIPCPANLRLGLFLQFILGDRLTPRDWGLYDAIHVYKRSSTDDKTSEL